MIETKENISNSTNQEAKNTNTNIGEALESATQAEKRHSSRGFFHSNKDIWDKTAALAPILSGLMIFATGFYCTYNYNQQQLRIQEVQTIEKFIPHLMGSEQSKRAAIMALSSLTTTETAGKVAQIFASSGTVQALQSLSQSGSEKDKAVATQALSKALENLAERENKLTTIEEDYKRAIESRDKKTPNDSHPDTPYNLNKLAQLYTIRGQYDLAEPLLKRSLAIREKIYGEDNQEVADSLKSLAEIYQLSNKHDLAESTLKRAHGIEDKLAATGAVRYESSEREADGSSVESGTASANGDAHSAPSSSASNEASHAGEHAKSTAE